MSQVTPVAQGRTALRPTPSIGSITDDSPGHGVEPPVIGGRIMAPERNRRVREGERDQNENASVCWNVSGRHSFRIGGHCVQRHGRAFVVA